jgi:hypothetical protein
MKCVKTLLAFFIITCYSPLLFSQVMFSSTPGKPDSSAMLEVRSNTRGFLPPVMSSTQRKAIKNPAPGLVVFDSTKQLFYGYLKNDGWRPFLMGYDTMEISEPTSPISLIDNSEGDELGTAVAIYGNLAVATAPADDIDGNIDQGSLYIFKLENGVWLNTQKLVAPDGAAGDKLGESVAMNDKYIFVGARYDDIGENIDEGSVYVFKILNGVVSFQQKLIGSLASANDFFGYYVVQNSQLFIGAPYDDIGLNSNQGSAYSFNLIDGAWIETQKIIQDSAALPDDFFGFGISIDSNLISIGAHINTNGTYGYSQNAVFIYENVNGAWQRRQKILQPDMPSSSKNDAFGYNTSLKKGILTAGAWLHDIPVGNKDRGSAYVFKHEGNSWNLIQKITPEDPNMGDYYGDYFGYNPRQSGGFLVTGDGFEDIAPGVIDRGAFYLYEWINTKWELKKKVISPTPTYLDLFGHSIDINENNIIVSAFYAENKKGKIYFYSLNN